MKETRYLVKKNSHGKVQYILFTLEGCRLTREWGLVGGMIQGVYHDYEPINEGKSNELSPEEAARADMERVIETKIKEGMVPADSLDDLPDLSDPEDLLDFNNIPTSTCLSKPTQKISAEALDRLMGSKDIQFFVKYNGGCHYIVIDLQGEVSIYTRRWDNHSAKYPSMVQTIKQSEYPPGTIMAVELCIDPLLGLEHMWAFKRISEIFKTNTSRGKCKADQSECHALQEKYPVRAAVFGFLYFGGEKVWHLPYIDLWESICKTIKPLSAGHPLFQPQMASFVTGEDVYTKAKEFKLAIEGFLAVDMRASFEVTMNGKPLRRLSWKIKARGEMDVIAHKGIVGKTPGQYGSIGICRKDKEGNQIDMGAVSGLKVKEGECDPENWNFPCVIEVSYDNIFPDTGLLQFGKYNKTHEDKLPEEVDLFSLVQ